MASLRAFNEIYNITSIITSKNYQYLRNCKKQCFCCKNLQIRALRKLWGIILRSPKARQPLPPWRTIMYRAPSVTITITKLANPITKIAIVGITSALAALYLSLAQSASSDLPDTIILWWSGWTMKMLKYMNISQYSTYQPISILKKLKQIAEK